jgi:hypothetical protein
LKTKRLLPFLCILICFTVLAGCVNQIGIPKRLSSGIMSAGGPVIDIQSNGTKHIAWVEERLTGIGQYTHAIIYFRLSLFHDVIGLC